MNFLRLLLTSKSDDNPKDLKYKVFLNDYDALNAGVPYIVAATRGNIEATKMILDAGAKYKLDNGEGPLVVEELLVNIPTGTNGHDVAMKMLPFLLDYKVSVMGRMQSLLELRSERGITTLMSIFTYGTIEIIEWAM